MFDIEVNAVYGGCEATMGSDDMAGKKITRTIEMELTDWAKVKEYQHGNAVAFRVEAIRQMIGEAHILWKTCGAKIAEYQRDHGIRSRTDAIRRMINEAHAAGRTRTRAKRS